MSKICRCCGSSFQENRCDRCGFPFINALDEAGEAELRKNIAEYRTNLLNNLTDFSIETHRYQWNESQTTLKLSGTESITITNGVNCLNRTVWSPENFGQYQNDTQPIPLTVSYRTHGKKETLTIPITPAKTSDFWHIGMEIDDSLRLTVRLGSDTKHTSSQPVSLTLR